MERSSARGLPAVRADSFETFVHETGTRLYRAALLLCGDHHLAEDLTQTTYAKVFASWPRVQRADNPVAYTRAILTKTFLSHTRLRRTSERPTEVLPDDIVEPADPTTRLDLFAALQELGPDDRAVIVLRYWEDLSVAETAAHLGIGESACRARSSRAIARLRRHLPDLED